MHIFRTSFHIVARVVLTLGVAIPSFAHAGGAPTDGLCSAGEKTWLLAVGEKSGKIIALCGGVKRNGDPAWLQFRTGQPGKPDLVFPARRAGSLKAFTVRRYTRPRTTYHKFHFEKGGRSYAILENHIADGETPYTATFRIRRTSDRTDISKETLTMESPQLNLMRLEYHVRTKPFDE